MYGYLIKHFLYHSVTKAKDLLSTISNADICEGNSDDRFLALPNIHKNSLIDATSKYKYTTSLSTFKGFCGLNFLRLSKCDLTFSSSEMCRPMK